MNIIAKTTFALAVAALMTLSVGEANAQSYNNGFGFGLGVQQSRGFAGGSTFFNPSGSSRFGGNRGNFGGIGIGGFGFGGVSVAERRQGLPYFAQFPPVYYSGVVKRPYGISPFAVPPGIVPTELQVAPVPQKVSNPYFNDVQLQQVEEQKLPVIDEAVQWAPNHYTQWQVQN